MRELIDETIYEKLKNVAQAGRLTNYTDVGVLVGLEPYNVILWGMLDDINQYEHSENRPMLSAVVIVERENKPGSGFFVCARELGRFHGDEDSFWSSELNKVWAYWGSH